MDKTGYNWGMFGLLKTMFKGPSQWRLAHWATLLPKIGALEPELKELGDHDLRKRSLALRYRARSGEPLVRLLVEAYALVREAGRRTLNMRHFDVQLMGGIAMFHRSIVEMQTGEGKTLTATLPMYLRALAGRGCQLATVNDYLAQRDADWMKPIYTALGLTVGVIQTQQPQPGRRQAYTCRRHLRHRQGIRVRLPPRPAPLAPHPRGADRSSGRDARGAAPTTRSRSSASPLTSPWWTRPTASSSTKPARR